MEVREPAVRYGKKMFTIEEYLEMENASPEKHEYYRGEIFAMSGAKMPHNEITSNLATVVGAQLKGSSCKPYGSDLRVHIESNTLFTYPDFTIICGKKESLNDDSLNILNPAVIFEVLSESSKDYDRGSKFMLYRNIPSLKAYIIIDSLSLKVEVYAVNAMSRWELTEYDQLNDIVKIPAVNISLRMKDIYEDTELYHQQ